MRVEIHKPARRSKSRSNEGAAPQDGVEVSAPRAPVFVVPTFHVAHILRGADGMMPVVAADIRRAWRFGHDDEVDVRTWTTPGRPILVWDEDPTELDAKVRSACTWLDALPRDPSAPEVAVDLETDGVDASKCRIRTCSLSPRGADYGVALLFGAPMPERHASALWHRLVDFLRSPAPKAIQNSNFDCVVFRRYGVVLGGTVVDTLPLHQIAEPEHPHDLAFIAQTYLDVAPWKAVFHHKEKRKTATVEELLTYNALDSIYGQQILPHLEQGVRDNHGEAVAAVMQRCAELAVRMTSAGMWVHEPTRRAAAAKLYAQEHVAVAKIRAAIRDPNWSLHRPRDRQRLLYDHLRLPVRTYTKKTSKPATSRAAYIGHLDDPLVLAFMEADQAHKLNATFVRKLPNLADEHGRFHPSWNVTGTGGSRWSSSPNGQNWPDWLRAIIQPPLGRVFVYADYVALELCLIAVTAGDEGLLAAFACGEDVHANNCAEIFGAHFTSLPVEHPLRDALRTLTKRVVYLANYGGEPDKMYESLRQDYRLPAAVRAILTPDRILLIHRTYLARHPAILRFRDDCQKFANQHGYLEIPPLGRRRPFYLAPVERNKAVNFPIQFFAGDIQNLTLLEIDEKKSPDAEILNNGHDAVLLECDAATGQANLDVVLDAMRWTIDGPRGPVSLKGKGEIRHAWWEPKEKMA